VTNQPPQGPPEGWDSYQQWGTSDRPTEPHWPSQEPRGGTQPERWQPRPPEVQLTQPLSDDERRAWLSQQVDEHVRKGWQIESRTENLASLRSGRPINHVLHLLLSLITCGVWALVWLYLAIFQGEKHKTISTRDADRPPQAVKPWYQDQRFLIAVAIVVLLIVIASIGGN
jgi:hypothetical protein